MYFLQGDYPQSDISSCGEYDTDGSEISEPEILEKGPNGREKIILNLLSIY